MANASGLVSPPPSTSIRVRISARFGISRSGFCCSAKNKKWVLRCGSGAVEGGTDGAAPPKPRPQRLAARGVKLVGCGSAVPKLSVSNDDLAQIVETSDEWIFARTGIHNRRVLSGGETLTGLAVEASVKALDMAQVEPDDVDVILMCTSTPDDLFGNGATIQGHLGCRNAWASDVTAACSGFLSGILKATGLIRGLGLKNVLVVGADALSRYVDWGDRGTCILFGDAAGAVLVQACDIEEDGLFGFDMHSDGEGHKNLKAVLTTDEHEVLSQTNGSPLFPPCRSSYSCIQMNGQEVFRFAIQCVPPSIEKSLQLAGISSSSIDWLLLHQANQRIIHSVASRLGIPDGRVISNLANYGNTSAGSIPLALDEYVRSGKVKAGDTIAMAGFGAGLTWGSAIVRWG